MKLHEYQAKDMFKKFGIPVPDGRVVTSGNGALKAAENLNGPPWVVKAQIHAGGRGKGGGVRVVHSPDEVKTAAESIRTIAPGMTPTLRTSTHVSCSSPKPWSAPVDHSTQPNVAITPHDHERYAPRKSPPLATVCPTSPLPSLESGLEAVSHAEASCSS